MGSSETSPKFTMVIVTDCESSETRGDWRVEKKLKRKLKSRLVRKKLAWQDSVHILALQHLDHLKSHLTAMTLQELIRQHAAQQSCRVLARSPNNDVLVWQGHEAL
jgi:hypothetical protein